jgi:hypothetical protein
VSIVILIGLAALAVGVAIAIFAGVADLALIVPAGVAFSIGCLALHWAGKRNNPGH